MKCKLNLKIKWLLQENNFFPAIPVLDLQNSKSKKYPELHFLLFHSVKSVPFRTADLKTPWATWCTQMLWNTDIVNKYMKAALFPPLQLLLFFPLKTLIFTNKSIISNLRCTEVTLCWIWAMSGHLFCRHPWINELRVKKIAIHHTR